MSSAVADIPQAEKPAYNGCHLGKLLLKSVLKLGFCHACISSSARRNGVAVSDYLVYPGIGRISTLPFASSAGAAVRQRGNFFQAVGLYYNKATGRSRISTKGPSVITPPAFSTLPSIARRGPLSTSFPCATIPQPILSNA